MNKRTIVVGCQGLVWDKEKDNFVCCNVMAPYGRMYKVRYFHNHSICPDMYTTIVVCKECKDKIAISYDYVTIKKM